jgi:2-polyprenyl-3-methyl-5-hydroxy-6-metoxy-1,4-benzoquinol methylase
VTASWLDPERERAELRAYLGERYDEDHLRRHHHRLEEELRTIGDEQRLYRTSEAYLYDLTVFAMSGTKEPYLATLAAAVPPGSRILDYGCGIGSDGLALLEAGYRVEFADFDNPSTAYLRWRLERRGLRAPVHDVDRGDPAGGFDLAYSFDVIEHVTDPFAFLVRLEGLAGLVLVNFLDPEPGETHLHHPLPVRDLLAHVAGRRLLRYRRHHGRSHLVLYAPERARGLGRLRSRAALWRGRLGARA